MKAFIDNIRKWIKSRNITSHAVAGVTTIIATTFMTDPTLRGYVLSTLVNHPKLISALGAACVMWLKYSPAHSPIGILQEVPAAKAALIKQDEKPAS